MKDLGIHSDGPTDVLEIIKGGHLHWSEFRNNVLEPFRIICSNTPRSEHIPTTFLARLQACQKNVAKYDEQRSSWRSSLTAQRGVGLSPIFPPYLVPATTASAAIHRCMMPRFSREGLPLRDTSSKKSLYELPTVKSFYTCGFNLDTFSKSEQYQVSNALRVSGSVVDFEKGEVLINRMIACPFLIFEKIATNSRDDIETARNHCAVAGAQNLKGQQQLFHKAFGLQTVSQPPVVFTCTINNDQAIIHFHCVDGEGRYTMAALCKFDLHDDDHFNTFQVWVEAIESWASIYLLPRIKGALSQASQVNQTPPPSPSSSLGGLSIDTNSNSVVLTALRRYWPERVWQQGDYGETPIDSSIAQCGTPMPARNRYSSDTYLSSTTPVDKEQKVSPSRRLLDMLSPIRTNLSAPPQIQTPRQLSAISNLSRDFFDGRSMSSTSPCRPPSLSPSSPEPEAPVSSKSPMLVLQRRLEIAVNEIQELRGQVEMLQNTLTYKTDKLERWLEIAMESKQITPVAIQAHQDLTPTTVIEETFTATVDHESPPPEIPGHFPQSDVEEAADIWQATMRWYMQWWQISKLVDLFLMFCCFLLCCSMAADDLGALTFMFGLTAFTTRQSMCNCSTKGCFDPEMESDLIIP